jgi:hypothetical protein
MNKSPLFFQMKLLSRARDIELRWGYLPLADA